MQPAQVIIPADIKKIVIVNHSQLKKSTFRDLQNNPVTLSYSDQKSTQYMYGVIDALLNSPRFEVMNKDDVETIFKESYSKRFQSLSWEQAAAVCNKYKADAALVLENHTLNDSTCVTITYSADYNRYNPSSNSVYGLMQFNNQSLWKVFQPNTHQMVDNYVLNDTLTYDAYGANSNEVLVSLPNIENTAYESCYKSGYGYGQRIAPSWRQVSRKIYEYTNKDFAKATKLAKNNQWVDAAELWKKYPYGKNKKLAALAAYNLAVASEALDFIDAALDWAAKSYFIMPDKNTSNYITILEERKKQKDLILKQFGEE